MSTLSPQRKRMVIVAALAGLGMIAVAGGGLAGSLKTATAITPPTSVDQVLATPSLAGVVEAVSPAVVSIEVTHKARPALTAQQRSGQRMPEHFKRFFGDDFAERFGSTPDLEPGPMVPSGGIGSGFIIDADGHIVTSNHVIAGAETVTVILDDGTRLGAEIVGQDTRTDLALLRVETDEPLPTIDAPINRGNSGGPAVNLHGEVIGVNTSIVSPSGGNVGIGFAVPAATAKVVIDDLKAHGWVMRGWLGVHIQSVTDDIAASLGLENAEGAIVASVQPESPAEAAGLESGDVIIAVDQLPVEDTRALTQVIAAIDAGTSATLTVWRDGQAMEITAAIANLAPPVEASAEMTGADEAGRLDTFGLRLENVDPEAGDGAEADGGSGAVVVAGVAPGSAAHRKGLRPGDVIVTVGNEPVGSVADVNERIEAAQGDGREAVLLLMSRDGREHFVALPFATS
ncbi:Probable periplasmic serine endoprotease DegP-like [Geodia barretti]|uniref:Probable periplasmic serine endoprotease DegP-like n=1 Tax=Geodia barretti TaxID=519541 RepID=A0AA35T1H3_GEOBA|nr:Probable periplasmic serine endoprotease DegP-like [Geodia barretti]